jgi:hypothetical protein
MKQSRDSKGRFVKKTETPIPLFKVYADKIYTGLAKHTFLGIMSKEDCDAYQKRTGTIVVSEPI